MKPACPATFKALRAFTLVEIMVVIAILGLLLALAIPNFLKTRTHARKQVCIENLSQIESAKQIWGVENSKKEGDTVTESDLVGATSYIKSRPVCPAGGTYNYTSIGQNASCNIEGHTL